VLELCCSRLVEGSVGRDGIRYNNIIYGKLDQQIWPMQDQACWFLADPVNADYITVCDKDGVPICRAYADRNLGISTSEVREANAMQRRAAKTVKKYPAARDTMMQTTQQRIAKLRRAGAQAERERRSQAVGESVAAVDAVSPSETIRVVRPDISAAMGKGPFSRASRTIKDLVRRGADDAMRRLSSAGDSAAVSTPPVESPRRITLFDLAKATPADSEADAAPVRSISLAELSAITEEHGDAT
jgi:hypothetical protein